MNISDELERILGEMDEDEKRKAEESNTAKQMALLAEGGTPIGATKKTPTGANDLIHELRAQMYGADPANTNMPSQQDFATQLMQYLSHIYFPGLVQQGQANVPTAAQGDYADVPSHANGGSIGYHQPGSLEQNMLELGGHRALPIIMALHKAAGGSIDLPKFDVGGGVMMDSDPSIPNPSTAPSLAEQIPTGLTQDGVPQLAPVHSPTVKRDEVPWYDPLVGAADVGKTLLGGAVGMVPAAIETGARVLGGSPMKAEDIYAQALGHYTPDLMTQSGKNMGEDLAGFMERNKIPLALPELLPFEEALVSGASEAIRKSNQALKSMTPPPGTLAMNVYHGTPHKFEKFDASKIGTGEGNQARGYGLYLAESPKTAEFYKDTLTPSQEFVNNEPINYDNPMHILAARLRDNGGDLAETREALEGLATPLQGKSKITVDLGKEALKFFDNGERPVLKTVKSDSNFYHVDLPDEHIENMLDWDKPIKEQSELVKNVANSLLPKIKQTSPYFDLNKVTGKDLYRSYQQYRGNHPEFASEGLKENGIFGIKYLDQDSRHAGEGTRNFVVFPGNEDKVKILTRNGVPVNPTELTPEQRQANFEAFKAASADPRQYYHGSVHNPNPALGETVKDMNDLLTSGGITQFRNHANSGMTFVSPDPKFSERFAGLDEFGNPQKSQLFGMQRGAMYPVHVQVKNPFDYENPEQVSNLTDEMKSFSGILKDSGFYNAKPEKQKEVAQKLLSSGNWKYIEDPEVLAAAKRLGHDGMYMEEQRVKNLGVFDPKRIKSSIANRGTYDITEPHMSKAQGGAV